MTRRRQRAKPVHHERWLVSYADFVTLLFALFVVLFASSQMDRNKAGSLAQSIQAAFHSSGVLPIALNGAPRDIPQLAPIDAIRISGVPPCCSTAGPAQADRNHSPMSSGSAAPGANLVQELETALASEIDQNVVSLEAQAGQLTLSLKEVGFFDSGQAELRPVSAESLGRIAAVLTSYPNLLRIEGHTDNVPISNERFASNWELSAARAIEITRLLIAQFGISPARLSVAGFAAYQPVASNANSAGRASNRRVDIVIIGPSAASLASRSQVSGQ